MHVLANRRRESLTICGGRLWGEPTNRVVSGLLRHILCHVVRPTRRHNSQRDNYCRYRRALLRYAPQRDSTQPSGVLEILPGGITLNLLAKVLVMIGSSASIGFGVWHFFVPAAWKWYSYIDPSATELVIAVRAINVFFSLSLALFGIVNILLVYGDRSNRYSIIVMLAATCVLWVTRLAFQLIHPQGSLNPVLQYGMLSAFVVVSLCYIISLCIVVLQRTVA